METLQDLTQSTGVPVDQATQNYTKRAPDLSRVFLFGKEKKTLDGVGSKFMG